MVIFNSFKNKKPVIAIDGTAGSGKGTLAKNISKSLFFDHLDTGLLYRYIAFLNINKKINLKNKNSLSDLTINYEKIKKLDLKTEVISEEASKISAMNIVRSFLLKFQRFFADHPPNKRGTIIDGRDIGSVVIPNAEVKFYIDAKIEIRVSRRLKELNDSIKSEEVYKDVFKHIQNRDIRDKNRVNSPLIKLNDSIFIDTSYLTSQDTLRKALKEINKYFNK